MTLWVISDTHFGHANILDYEPARRAWCTDIETHDRAIIEAWRAVVAPDDLVLHCGDFSLGSRERAVEIVAQLPGHLDIVLGNHDRGPNAMESLGFSFAQKRLVISRDAGDIVGAALYIELGIEGAHIIARHAPSAFTADELASGALLLHGHMHGHVPGANDAAPDRRHAYPSDPAVRSRLVDASIEALPTAPGPMRLADLISYTRERRR